MPAYFGLCPHVCPLLSASVLLVCPPLYFGLCPMHACFPLRITKQSANDLVALPKHFRFPCKKSCIPFDPRSQTGMALNAPYKSSLRPCSAKNAPLSQLAHRSKDVLFAPYRDSREPSISLQWRIEIPPHARARPQTHRDLSPSFRTAPRPRTGAADVCFCNVFLRAVDRKCASSYNGCVINPCDRSLQK